MDVLKARLHQHKTTRRLLRKSSGEQLAQPETDVLGADLRASLEWQDSVAAALIAYGDAVQVAVEALLCAQEAIVGADVVRVCGPASTLASALLDGLRCAQAEVSRAKQLTALSLRALRANFAVCAEDVRQADEATIALEHYTGKIVCLADEDFEQQRRHQSQSMEPQLQTQSSSSSLWSRGQQADDRFTRNRDKLQNAALTASAAQIKAKESLRACSEKRSRLGDLAQLLLQSLAKGLCGAAEPLAPLLVVAKVRTQVPRAAFHGTHPDEYRLGSATAVRIQADRLQREADTGQSAATCPMTSCEVDGTNPFSTKAPHSVAAPLSSYSGNPFEMDLKSEYA